AGPAVYWGCMFGLDLGLVGAAHAYGLLKAANAVLLLGYLGWRAVRSRDSSSDTNDSSSDTNDSGSDNDSDSDSGSSASVRSSSDNGTHGQHTEHQQRQQPADVGSTSCSSAVEGRSRSRRRAGGGDPAEGSACSGAGSGAGASGGGTAARPNAHVEMLTSPLSVAASAHEYMSYEGALGNGNRNGNDRRGGGPAAAGSSAGAATTSSGAAAAAAYDAASGIGGRSRKRVDARAAPAAASALATAAAGATGTAATAVAAGINGRQGLYCRIRTVVSAIRTEAAEVLEPRACWEYVKFGFPAAAMSCLEWWAYEALVIMAGWLPDSEVSLGCLGICQTVGGWAYMLPQALATATAARVASALGAGDAEGAKRNF
ncbi:hypothetical protein Agub_g1299, partial [Astrephomene gubernaculifera]